MIFRNLSVFQNIAFIIGCIGVILMIVYVICVETGLAKKTSNMQSDDIDNADEDFQNAHSFIFNAFSIKGSIFFVAILFSLGFMLSLFMQVWLSFVISAVVACGIVVGMAFIDREKVVKNGDLAVVCEDIPENNLGNGKVQIASDGTEIDAVTNGKKLKKGKRVVIVEYKENKVVVKKYKKGTK